MKKPVIAVLVLIFSLLLLQPVQSAVFLQRVHLKAVGDIMVHDVQYHQAFDPYRELTIFPRRLPR